MERRKRGSGLRYTLPFFWRYTGLWLVVTIAAVLVAAVSTYLLFGGRPDASSMRNALFVVTALSILAVVALAVFTTHRLAGPWIAIRRALESVRDGNLETRLRVRAEDPQIRDVEVAFDQMMASLRDRLPK